MKTKPGSVLHASVFPSKIGGSSLDSKIQIDAIKFFAVMKGVSLTVRSNFN